MNTQEKNILLAEFLGAEQTMKNIIKIEGLFVGREFLNKEELIFNLDWNWLMKVVDKIDNLEIKGNTFAVDIYQSGAQVFQYWEFNNELISVDGKDRKEATFNACVEFVIWYNEQNSKK